MTPGAEAEVRRWMKQVLGHIRSLTNLAVVDVENEIQCVADLTEAAVRGDAWACVKL